VTAVIWHDLECGAYAEDLALWRSLAAEHGDPVLDIGAGTGRVSLDLARRGHRVTALDSDPELLDELARRAEQLPLSTVRADAREFELAQRFALCVVPMQTVQLLGGSAGRRAFLARARSHLRPGGLLACAIVAEVEPLDCAASDLKLMPQTARVDGNLYVSRTTHVRVCTRTVCIERERSVFAAEQALASAQRVPERYVVELDRLSASQLLREGREAGLTPAGTRSIAATETHTGSTVVMLGA
jgi:precorrin-6B methylase 2